MLIDCHIHTTRYSPCSHLSPYEACKLAIKRGLDAIVITEHQIQWNKGEIKELQDDFPQLKIYTGLEVTLKEGIDIVIITENKGLKIPFMISFHELINLPELDMSQSFIFVAHLFRWSTKISFNEKDLFPYIDGIEMNSINILMNGYTKDENGYLKTLDYPLYEMIKNKWNLTPIYNTDTHSPLTIGLIANNISIPTLPRNEKDLAMVLKKEQIKEFQNADKLFSILRRH